MADVESNIHVNIDTSGALASLKALQRQISAFHTQMAKSGTAASAVSANQAQNLMNSINATGKFQASMRTVTSSTESFTDALERNKLTSREYFRYTGAATKTFGKLFKSEFDTISKVARERVKDVQTQYIKMGRGANGALQAIAVRPLTLDMKNLGTQTAIAAQKQQMLNQLLKQGSTNLLNFGKNTQWAGRQLMVGFTVPLAMLGVTASKTFMKLEEQAIRFKRVYGELFTTAEETDAMVKDIQLLAKEYTKYGVAVEETMKMAADAAAQGKMGADLMAQVAQATRLAVLGGVEQEDALKTTISVTNAFGVATEDLAKKIDFLNAVENQTVVSIEDLTIALPKAGPVVKQLGGDVEDLAFFLTAMKEGGINASEGANALKSGLASLINPSEKASKMLMGLGVNIKGIVEGNNGDVKSTVVEFAQALDTLDPLNRARAIEQLFGKFQFSRLSTLFQNVIGEGTQASRVLKLANATTEELAILSERELGKIQNTTTYKFKKSMEDLKVSIAPVGEQFLKALTPIVEFVGKILDKFNNLGDGSKKFLTIVTVAVAGVGPILLMTFGLIANAVANIIKLFASMKSMYNRTGSASVVLGEQTNYLTKEQLEASAVAASLDQVHTKLKQTFTSEASAVNMLANSYRRAIAAQAGFTGPTRVGPGTKGLKKYSSGTTKVPGSGNQDTVPTMLTPGEAVIPAQSAQDPANRPVIAQMVAGKTVQGFNSGTTGVTANGKSTKTVFAHATDHTIFNLDDAPDEYKDKAKDFKSRGIPRGLAYSGLGFDISEEVHKALSQRTPALDVRAYEAEIRKPGAVLTMTSKLMDPPLSLSAGEAGRVTNSIRNNLLTSLGNLPDGFKINDPMVYSRMGNAKTGILGGLSRDPKTATAIQRILSPHGITGYGVSGTKYDAKPATPIQLYNAIAASKSNRAILPAIQRLVDHYPNYEVQVKRDANGNIVAYNRPEVGRTAPFDLKDKTSNASLDLEDNKFKPGRSGGDTGAVKIGGTASAASRKAAMAYLQNVVGQVTSYGNQISKGTGYSNRAANNAAGVFETADGKGKVYVKPMMDLQSALAEQRATQIAREVHGLDSPEQKIRIVKDPVTKKTMYALESAFDPKFDPSKMSNTFTKEEYIRQNVAAALRADKDLGRGNLSGNILADVGPAGVFATASGQRSFADSLPSMEEQARINLDIEETNKGRKKFFSQATVEHARSFKTPELYETAMKDEINRVLPKLRETVSKFDLNPDESKMYKAMVKRLEGGLNANWKDIWKRHTSIVIKPGELIQNTQTGEVKKPKTTKKPGSVKSSSGKPVDTLLAPALKKNEVVVQTGSARKGPKGVTLPGFADAPYINITGEELARTKPRGIKRLVDPAGAIVSAAKASIAEAKAVGSTIGTTLSQSAAAASRTALYGGGPIDPEQKSLRRNIEKQQREQARTQARIAASKTKLYGTGPMDADAKSLRRQMESRTKLANSVGYQKRIISERAAANAQLPMLGPNRPTAYDRTVGSAAGQLRNFKAQENKGKYLRDKVVNRPAGKGMGMGGAMGVASGVAMIGSMAPGKVGEVSQKIMMPLMGMAMIMPMLQNKFSALAVGVGAVVAAYAYQRMAFDKAQDAAMELTEALGSGTKAIKSLSEFSTKVGAGEIMDRRRKDSFSPFQIKTGKTTFGESYMAGEQGKAMAKNVTETMKIGGKGVAKDQVANQLTTAVASGVLDPAQARSIAANLGKELGDYSFGIEVNSKLIELLGPNGENLLKDGVDLEVRLLQETRSKMNLASTAAQKAGGWTAGDKARTGGYSIGGAAAGAGAGFVAAGIGAAGAAAAGAAVGSAVPVVGTIIGAALGLGVGAFLARKDRNKRIGEASGASIAMQKIALQQQQELTDSVELQYQKELAIAKAAGDTAKIKKLSDQFEKDQISLLTENGKLVADIQKSYADADGATKSALMTGADKAVTKQYQGTALEDVATLAKSTINDSGVSKEQQYTLKMQMASGQIDPMQMIEIFDTFGKDKAAVESVVTIIGKFGGAFANQMMGIVGMFKDKKQAAKFVADISAKTPKEAQKQLELFQRISQSGTVVEQDVLLNYYNKNPKAAELLQESLTKIDALKGKIKLEVLTEVLGAEEMAALKADQEYFDKLPPEQQKVYLQNMKVMFSAEGDPAMKLAYDNWVNEKGGANAGKSFSDYVTAKTQTVTETSTDGTKTPTVGTGNGSGSNVQSSPLDDLVKKLRDVRKNQIKVTEGWSASRKALDGLFGGSKTIDVFSGIENDLRKLGGSQDFIEMIVGMDPKEYEKQKNSLFVFDNKKNIVGLKRDAKNIQEALNSIAMGDWNSSMEAESKALSDQGKAFDRIAGLGVPVANAYDLITDKTIAAAIANGVNDKTLKSLIAKYKGLTAAQEASAAVSAVKTDIAQFKKDRVQEDRIRKTYNPQTAFAINSDENLKSLENAIAAQEAKVNALRAKGGDSETLKAPQAELNKLIGDFNTRLDQLKSTIGYMQDMFNEGFGNAMESFDVQETALNIQFKLDTKGNSKIIEEAQNQIAAIQYNVDDKEAALKIITDQEEVINKKYDERIAALDEIEKANASISNQQKGQLTLAEALTSGDIAAAARAAQDMRAQQAADAVTKQKEAVEKSREYEINNVKAYDPVTKTYRTRKELEEDIKKLQNEIFEIEEKKIEPAQEFIRLRQIQLDKDVEGITVLGRTRDAWEAIKNQVDLALIKSAAFVDSMGLAISTQAQLIAGYKAQTGGTDGAFLNESAFVPVGPQPGETIDERAAREKREADAAAAAKAKTDAANATAKAEADKAAAEKARVAAINNNPNVPSILAAAESGAIGAASIAAKIKAAADAVLDAAEKARVAAMQAAQPVVKTSAQIIAERRARDGYLSSGGMVPKYFSVGGFARGTDTVPAMLTPGEFIMSKYAVDTYGVDTMRKINNGEATGGAVYNNTYTLTVNAKTNANPNEIAQAVMSTIKQVDDRRVRGVVLNGR